MREFVVMSFYSNMLLNKPVIVLTLIDVSAFTTSHRILLQECGGSKRMYLSSTSRDLVLYVCLSQTRHNFKIHDRTVQSVELFRQT